MLSWLRLAFMLTEHFIRSATHHAALPLYAIVLPCQWSMPVTNWELLYFTNDMM